MPNELTVLFYVSYGALWILVISQSLILLGLVQIVYQLQRTGAAAGSFEGKDAPEFSAKDLSGAAIASTNFTGRMTGLLFISTSCQSCIQTLQDDVEYLYHKAQGNVIVICQAGREDCAQLAEKYELTVPMVADEDNHISQLYGITSVPTVVLVNAANRIQSYGHPEREELVEVLEKAAPMAAQGAN